MDQSKGSARIDVGNRWIEVQLTVVMDSGLFVVGTLFLVSDGRYLRKWSFFLTLMLGLDLLLSKKK